MNIDTGEGEIPDFSFVKYKLTHFVKNELEFKSFVENFKNDSKKLKTEIKKIIIMFIVTMIMIKI